MPPTAADRTRYRHEHRRRRTALALAVASVAAWLAVLTWRQPGYIADEWRHYEVVQDLLAGRWPTGRLPMLPAYHLAAAGVAWLAGFSMFTLRALSAVLALLALWLLSRIELRLRPPGGESVLLLAWNPLLFPYLAMAYTETAALVPLLAALYAHLRRLPLAAGLALLLAGILRQSSVIWAGFLAAWAGMDLWRESAAVPHAPAARARVLARRLWPYLLPLVFAAGFYLAYGGLTAGQEQGTRAKLNLAQFYLFGLTAAVLWAPLWVEELVRQWRLRFAPALAHAWVCALVLAAIGLLELGFRNPHPWNADPQFLRNRVLVALWTWVPLRLSAGAVLVGLAATAVPFIARQPRRRLLALTWLAALLFIGPHWLVDPRYYILPAVFVNLLTDFSPAQSRRLTVWYALLSLATCAYIVTAGNPHGGMP